MMNKNISMLGIMILAVADEGGKWQIYKMRLEVKQVGQKCGMYEG